MPLEYRTEWVVTSSSNTGTSVHHGRAVTGSTPEQGAQALADRVHAFWATVAASMPNDVQISFPSEVVDVNTTTGLLTAVYEVTPGALVTGGSTLEFAAPVGARAEWRTPAIVAGRRLRGRTFMVPLAGGAFATDGGLDETTRAFLQDAADDYIDNSVFAAVQTVVWSRTHGILADITSAFVPDEAAVLRSRRD